MSIFSLRSLKEQIHIYDGIKSSGNNNNVIFTLGFVEQKRSRPMLGCVCVSAVRDHAKTFRNKPSTQIHEIRELTIGVSERPVRG